MEILDGPKTWEIRGERERIVHLKQGTWQLMGEADLVDCLEVGRQGAKRMRGTPFRFKKKILDKGKHLFWTPRVEIEMFRGIKQRYAGVTRA